MINKKTIPVVALLLLVGAAVLVIAGASQSSQYRIPPGNVVQVAGAARDQDSGTSAAQAVPAAPTLPAATGQVLLNEDFSTPALKGWHSLASTVGAWSVTSSGALQQAGSNTEGDISDEDSALVTDNGSLADGVFEAQVFPTSGDPVGVVFRGSDAGYYRVWLAANLPNSAPKARLQMVANGNVRDIVVNTTWQGYAYSQWQTIQVVTSGSHITVSVDGTQIFNTTDSTLGSGSVGVWTVADRGAKFDNIRVQTAVAGR